METCLCHCRPGSQGWHLSTTYLGTLCPAFHGHGHLRHPTSAAGKKWLATPWVFSHQLLKPIVTGYWLSTRCCAVVIDCRSLDLRQMAVWQILCPGIPWSLSCQPHHHPSAGKKHLPVQWWNYRYQYLPTFLAKMTILTLRRGPRRSTATKQQVHLGPVDQRPPLIKIPQQRTALLHCFQ